MDEIPYSRTYEYQKPYGLKFREVHKERLSALRKRRIICKCGVNISFSTFPKHIETEKHKKRLTEIALLNISI